MKTSRQTSRELRRLNQMNESEIDTTDVPEHSDWSGAAVGKFYRPVKQQVTLCIDADVLAWFKARGGSYQTELIKALREHMLRGMKKGG